MGIDEGNLQVIGDVDVMLENWPITIVILNLLLIVYSSTIQYSNIAITIYDSKCHRTIPYYIMSCSSVVHYLHHAHRGLYSILSKCIQYVFAFHSTCYICDSRMISIGQLIGQLTNTTMSGRSSPLYYSVYTYINRHAGTPDKKQKQNRNNVIHHRTW